VRSIPILAIPTSAASPGKEAKYTYIKQSLVILIYLEDLSETPGSDFYTPGKPSMRGRTALEKARVAELLFMIDECATLFRYWYYSGCHLNPEPNIETAKFMEKNLFDSLEKLNSYFLDRDLEFLCKPLGHAGTEGEGEEPDFMDYVTIADCVLFAFFQYANGMFGRDLSAGKGLEKLREFWERFGRRESARLETEYDREMQKEAMVWYDGAA
jgi:glutathione S-transferase